MVIIQAGETNYVTQINTLTCRPEDQEELVRRMTEQAMEVMEKQPGFISLTIHRSLDGTRVVKNVQWRDQQGLDAAHAAPDFKRHFEGYRPLIQEAGPHLFTIAHQRGESPA